ncbi:MAG: hypothetical protein BGO26_03725 [Actinobacteria bacterium 69-20]|jgi:hypothetical protein|nr:hypothetical protein [Actinomycetota bacterium]OJV23929.1 MAG: hypothetical protein BGO26_03725 [Actinobacteria bacterium 69-20]
MALLPGVDALREILEPDRRLVDISLAHLDFDRYPASARECDDGVDLVAVLVTPGVGMAPSAWA